MSWRSLVDTDTVARHLGAPGWRLFDCRHDLAQPALGAQQYAQGHLPGALFAHLDDDLSGVKNGRNGRHPLPEPEAFAAWLGRQGVQAGDQLVAYDAGNGTMAARLWSMLRWIGHEDAAVLDGGLARWLAEGRALSTERPHPTPTVYRARVQRALQVDAASLATQAEGADLLLLDARTAERYRGDAEPIDPVAGRIPGALNRYCGENLAPDGRFKSAAELRREYAAVLGAHAPTQVVHYCGSGVAACHNQLAMEVAGLGGSRVYTGSWSEWIADPQRPRERDASA